MSPRPNFMALLTVSTESALTKAGSSVPTARVFHRLAANFCFCVCVLSVPRLAQKFLLKDTSVMTGNQFHKALDCLASTVTS